MAEVLVRFTTSAATVDGVPFTAQAWGSERADGLWEGWIEFAGSDGAHLRTPRETEQPNRDALLYWAEGLTTAYLEGALRRALDTPVRLGTPAARARPHAVLDPFATYLQGEGVLRQQLAALSRDHLI